MHGTLPEPTLTTLLDGDCLDLLRDLPEGSIDTAICDLPYCVTRHASDRYIDLEEFFRQMRRVLTETGNLLMFCQQPFTTDLMMQGRDLYKSELVWEKTTRSNFPHASDQHLKIHETILHFSKGVCIHESRTIRKSTYNPQGVINTGRMKVQKRRSIGHLGKGQVHHNEGVEYPERKDFPTTILFCPKEGYSKKRTHHSFKKPVALLEYLIKTFSNPGDIVLDPSMGSGSTGVACVNTNRHFVGMEIDRTTFREAEERILKTPRRV